MRFRRRLSELSARATDAVYTSMCAECDRRGSWVCADCRARVRPISRRGCARCGVLLTDDCECGSLPDEIEQLWSVYPYAGWVRSSIHRFKYEGEFARAASLAIEFDRIRGDLGAIDLIVPVPIHRRRLRERGFNQSALIARGLAPGWGAFAPDALERRVDNERQVGKARDERWLNVAGVFCCPDTAAIRTRRVAVIDDVITTGATVSECAVALKAAGASSVVGISLARG
jgi:competence protein ComFC